DALPIFEVELAGDRDDGDDERAVHLGEQRLEHARGVDAERLGRLHPEGQLAARVVDVLAHGVGYPGLLEDPECGRAGRRGPAAHRGPTPSTRTTAPCAASLASRSTTAQMPQSCSPCGSSRV